MAALYGRWALKNWSKLCPSSKISLTHCWISTWRPQIWPMESSTPRSCSSSEILSDCSPATTTALSIFSVSRRKNMWNGIRTGGDQHAFLHFRRKILRHEQKEYARRTGHLQEILDSHGSSGWLLESCRGIFVIFLFANINWFYKLTIIQCCAEIRNWQERYSGFGPRKFHELFNLHHFCFIIFRA